MSESVPEAELIDSLVSPAEMGILPLRDSSVFPYMPQLLTASRTISIRAVEAAADGDSLIGLFAQRDAEVETPGREDLYEVGTIAKIHRQWRMPDGSLRLIVQGLARGQLAEMVQTEPFLKAVMRQLPDEGDPEATEVQAMCRTAHEQFGIIVKMTSHLPDELQVMVMNIDHPGRLADFVAANLDLQLAELQQLLELVDIGARLKALTELLTREVEILQVGSRIQSQVQEKLGKSHHEFILREQLKQIRRELGGGDPQASELDELRASIEAAQLPTEASEAAERELGRLEKMMPESPEYSVARTYLDWLVALPWAVSTDDHLEIGEAARILDEDHYGLDMIKERILEYLAVRRLRKEMKGPILCFVGPPGVGKTSLGRSIARALDRKFARISLGGVRDEAEIRGHRRTYVGSLPGRIIQGLRKAGSNNPVFILDEIDKLGMDFRGDPAAALLEVLDPEQNFSFADHYLDVPFDLSKVMFITTGNLLDPVPPALRDRMEEIPLPGYVQRDKVEISRRHLLPRQLEEHGLADSQLRIEDATVERVIQDYTREAGLRNLERQLGSVCRKAARRFVEGRKRRITVKPENVEDYLGPVLFFPEEAGRTGEVGVATGLAATAAGGEILFIEASRMQGERKLILTGQLGEVMQESAQAAMSYLRSQVTELGIDPELLASSDIHLHVPAGATPKDGPSAGTALTAALFSLFTDRPVRSDVAMTGEITLRGRVLPVGGIRDKVMGAQRAGIATVILPRKNEKDLQDVPVEISKLMRFELVDHIDEVLEAVLQKKRRARRGARTARASSKPSRKPAPKAAAKSKGRRVPKAAVKKASGKRPR